MLPGYSTYAATKGAIEQLTRVFSKEIGSRGINVNSISPGPTDTELFMKGKPDAAIDKLAGFSPFNRIGQPADTGKVVVFLASDLPESLGSNPAPALMDRPPTVIPAC